MSEFLILFTDKSGNEVYNAGAEVCCFDDATDLLIVWLDAMTNDPAIKIDSLLNWENAAATDCNCDREECMNVIYVFTNEAGGTGTYAYIH